MTRRRGIIAAALAALALLVADGRAGSIVFTSEGCELLNVIEDTAANGRRFYRIADITYESSALPEITDCVLSFNRPVVAMGTDDAGHYRIKYASYEPVRGLGVHGAGGAQFFKAQHRVELQSERNLWLGNCEDLGSFSLEFRFRADSLRDESVIFSRIGYASGKKNGLEIVLKNGRLTARFHEVFRDQSGRPRVVYLNRGRRLKLKAWHHALVSFDRVSGKLSKRINGREDEAVYATESGEPFVNVLRPAFECDDLPAGVVGKDFSGIIDEFRISHRHIADLKRETEIASKRHQRLTTIGREPVNREGVVTGPVHTLPATGSQARLFSWREELSSGTFVWMEFRTSDDLFGQADPEPKWYRIVNNQRDIYRMRVGSEFLRGKYCQWRAHLVPSPDGRRSPRLWDIALEYRVDAPPRVPLMVAVAGAGDKSVTLKWKKNVEEDLCGYKIYYGARPGRYDGIITHSRERRITNALSSTNEIEITVTNHVIEENRARDTRGLLSYPIMKNNVLYFFAVSAYDTYRIDTKYNHESALSAPVTGRPFAGSEIRPEE